MNCNLPEERDIHWATILGKLVEMKFVGFFFQVLVREKCKCGALEGSEFGVTQTRV